MDNVLEGVNDLDNGTNGTNGGPGLSVWPVLTLLWMALENGSLKAPMMTWISAKVL
jgi:hypothetical protein